MTFNPFTGGGGEWVGPGGLGPGVGPSGSLGAGLLDNPGAGNRDNGDSRMVTPGLVRILSTMDHPLGQHLMVPGQVPSRTGASRAVQYPRLVSAMPQQLLFNV
ncbi:hypothetical protein [Mesobacillus selenatarsenatis]|uniref:Uncharacterized protein n=1 Tax=Mesobacillus selenatarsenatis (strain DSM 18680 / JCM 14380 / FERM P-15431 / SF-1) TaxID=1321606 RepID=A0A0A8XAA9_MESS1|nr:hypothetical protein [Mesobacillus selenatarsenatis]GAM15937.1 hypothetical protein SAMD00020551_4108 [Mesobacillus selenatarsenatis SF-1]